MRTTGRSKLAALALATAVCAGGCDDAPTEPTALLVTAETEAALRVSESLPHLPTLVELAARRGTLDASAVAALERAQALWFDGGSAPDPIARRAMRREAYHLAAPALAAALDSLSIGESRKAVERWLRLAGTVEGAVRIGGVSASLSAGRALLAEVDAALQRGRTVEAVAMLLEAADRLSETTPRSVARRLILEAEDGLASRRRAMNAAEKSHDPVSARAERLVRGAREALDAGDPVRAIRRAYYAGQLLGVR